MNCLDASRQLWSASSLDGPVRLEAGYRRGLERITDRIRELEGKRRDIDETLEGLRALEAEANERLDRALREETKRRPNRNTNGEPDLGSREAAKDHVADRINTKAPARLSGSARVFIVVAECA